MKKITLLHGDCLDKLKELDDNSIDSIVTDPPYGLSFMGKKWDYDVPSVDIWKECLRVLKPGGHLLSFAGSRTYHRMAVRIEDAGFDIRDQIMWIYGSGFPKSHNIGKAVDKIEGNEREELGELKPAGFKTAASGYADNKAWSGKASKGNSVWEGWGTALKPAHEPIVMARKPVEGTIADNVLEYGVGGLNIDGTRIGNEVRTTPIPSTDIKDDTTLFGLHPTIQHHREETTLGRWPANVIMDEEAGKVLDEQSGITYSGPTNQKVKYGGGVFGGGNGKVYAANSGGASRFFYCPKANKKDKGDNTHPTVKPTDLMAYLIRLVTPKDGFILDPFMGSGSTGKAAVIEEMRFVGIEREKEYFDIAEERIMAEADKRQYW